MDADKQVNAKLLLSRQVVSFPTLNGSFAAHSNSFPCIKIWFLLTVLLEFYAPWCGDCEKLTSILDEVAVSFENDADVIIAKLVRIFFHTVRNSKDSSMA